MNPVIVGGDFNASPESDTVQVMLSGGAVDMFVAGDPGVTGETSFDDPFDIADPSEEADKRIDYLFMVHDAGTVSASGLFLDEAGTVGVGPEAARLWPSDHIGVAAVFIP